MAQGDPATVFYSGGVMADLERHAIAGSNVSTVCAAIDQGVAIVLNNQFAMIARGFVVFDDDVAVWVATDVDLGLVAVKTI